MIPWIVVVGVLIIVILMGALSLTSSRSQAQADVAATIFPVYDLTRAIAEPETSVALILDPGASPHTFEVTPRKATELATVDTIFAIGHGLDEWVGDVTNVSGASIVTVDGGVELLCAEENGACNPHYWLDAQNAIAIANTIRDTLIARDPKHAEAYTERARLLIGELEMLDAELQEQLDALEHTALVTFHDGFSYFAAAYGLNVRGVFEPSPGREPSARRIAELQELVSVYNVRTLYREPQLSAVSIRAFVNDVNVSIATLDPIGGVEKRQNYFELMRYNARVLQETLDSTIGGSR